MMLVTVWSGCGSNNQVEGEAVTGDFRRGSVSENYRRCGKPACHCAQPDDPGHGPRCLRTRTVAGRGSRGRQLAAGEVAKVRRELGT